MIKDSHQSALIIGPIGAFFVSTVNNEVIFSRLSVVLIVLQGLIAKKKK